MRQLAMAVMAALLLQAPALKAQAGGQASVQTGKSAAAPAGQQISPSAAPATSSATSSEPAPEAGAASQPMSPEEADAAVDKLKQTIRDSMANGRGPRDLTPEAQKAIAETADKLLSDPAVRGAIAHQIKDFRPPWQQSGAFWLTGLLVPIAFFAFCGLYFWLRFRQKQAKLRAQMDMQTQLLGKFSSGTELAAFLASPAGLQMVEGLGSTRLNVRRRIVTHFSIGAALAILGFGFLFTERTPGGGVFFLSIGIGFLISAWLTSRLADQTGSIVSTPPTLPPTPQQ